MVNIEELPNEILVKIFTFFSVRDLGRCSRVSHRFRTISRDESMWQKINLYGIAGFINCNLQSIESKNLTADKDRNWLFQQKKSAF